MTDQAYRAHRQQADALRDQQRPREAAEAYRQALALNPQDAAAHFYLGLMCRDLGQLPAAVEAFREAARLEPRSVEALSNLGLSLGELNRPDEAIGACQAALALDRNFAAAWCNLGLALQTLGQMEQAITSFRNAVQLNPGEVAWHSNLLFALNFRPGSSEQVFAEHRDWAERHADPLTAAAAPHALDFTPQRRLRVGYVSSHFRHHAVNAFVEPLLEAHDRDALDVVAYCDVPPAQQDAATRRLQGHVTTWREIAGRSDADVAEMIRADRIDILVDLAGHIGGNRLLVFARRPAPVQVTYLGYQNTTGMRAMEYRLTDAVADPPGHADTFYTERLVRLSETFFCYGPYAEPPPVDDLPARRRGAITFGSFNNFAKVSPEALDAWAQILAAVERSRLVLLVTAPAWLRDQVRGVFARRGVAPDRIEFADQRPTEQFYELVREVDVALDSFPFNGHTTTCDCLWLGVPVVMFAGDRYAARFGGTALVHAGLGDLIAERVEDYVARAVALAGDLERLAHLRATLADTLRSSPIMDARRFAADVEQAYRAMWLEACERARQGG